MTTPIRRPNSEPVGESATEHLNDAPRSLPCSSNGTLCAFCEEPLQLREGKWTSGEVATLGDLMGTDEQGVFIYPPDPHCYWSPDGLHEPEATR